MATSSPSAQRLFGAALLLVASGAGVATEPPVIDVLPIQAVLLSFDCEARTLPTQREVGEALGQFNFSQVYATRARLMNDVGRACQRTGVERVDVALQPSVTPRPDARSVALRSAPTR